MYSTIVPNKTVVLYKPVLDSTIVLYSRELGVILYEPVLDRADVFYAPDLNTKIAQYSLELGILLYELSLESLLGNLALYFMNPSWTV